MGIRVQDLKTKDRGKLLCLRKIQREAWVRLIEGQFRDLWREELKEGKSAAGSPNGKQRLDQWL